MRSMVMAMCLLATPAMAGEVWLTIDHVEDDASIHVDLPAVIVIDPQEPWKATHAGRPVDLRTELMVMRTRPEGAKRTYHVTTDKGEDVRVDLHHRPSHTGRVSQIAVTAGDAFSLSLPLDQGAAMLDMQWPDGNITGDFKVDLSASGQDDPLASLRGAAPTTLLEIRSKDGKKGDDAITIRVQ